MSKRENVYPIQTLNCTQLKFKLTLYISSQANFGGEVPDTIETVVIILLILLNSL